MGPTSFKCLILGMLIIVISAGCWIAFPIEAVIGPNENWCTTYNTYAPVDVFPQTVLFACVMFGIGFTLVGLLDLPSYILGELVPKESVTIVGRIDEMKTIIRRPVLEKWFVYDSENSLVCFDSEAEAKQAFLAAATSYRNDIMNGNEWKAEFVSWGKVYQNARLEKLEGRPTYDAVIIERRP